MMSYTYTSSAFVEVQGGITLALEWAVLLCSDAATRVWAKVGKRLDGQNLQDRISTTSCQSTVSEAASRAINSSAQRRGAPAAAAAMEL